MRLPDIWGEGQLFAFSGLDGESNWAHHFIGSLTDGPGVTMRLRPDVTLSFVPEKGQIAEVRPRCVLGDLAELDVVLDDGRITPATMAFASWDCFVGTAGAGLKIETDPPLEETVQTGSGYIALATRRVVGGTQFALVLHPTDRYGLPEDAQRAVAQTLTGVLRDRAAFVKSVSLEGVSPPTDERTYRKAASVLKVNAMSPEGAITRRWTTPDRWPHQHMWLWDSVFHALGWRYLNRVWAEECLLALLHSQTDDGRVPLSVAPDGPNPEESQPPLIAWGVWEVFQRHGNVEFLREAYEPLQRYVEWFCRERDRNGNGLLEWLKNEESTHCHCGESGLDNSPRFDRPGLDDAVDLSAYIVKEMRSLAQIGRTIGSEMALEWERRADVVAATINDLLWDEGQGLYFDRQDGGDFVRIKTCASFAPMWAGVPSAERAARLVEHLRDEREFAAPLPVPSVALDEPTHSEDMWRGSTWLNYNYLIYRGLLDYGFKDDAAALRHATMEQIQHWYERTGCLFEFYDCRAKTHPYHLLRKGGRAGLGHGIATVRDLGWTAAVYIALAHEPPL